MKVDLTPYARGAMTFEEKRLLSFHVSSLKVHAVGDHPGKTAHFKAWITDRHDKTLASEPDVPARLLFATISTLLAEAGDPLPAEDPWASLEQVMP